MVWIPLFLRSLERGSVRPLMYGKTAKPRYGIGGSTQLKNIPTNSSGDGVVLGSGFFFRIFEMKDWG